MSASNKQLLVNVAVTVAAVAVLMRVETTRNLVLG